MHQPATIFALSSAPGRAGVAVVRISGPNAGTALDALTQPRPEPRKAALRKLTDPESGAILDQALVLWFAAPKSETGEDLAELHLHGGPAIVRAVLAALARRSGCRFAEPGEFARRAFENGKIDLAEAEGLADLVAAETEAQRLQALRQMGGALSALYEGWRSDLISASALVESAIDFSDEADIAADAYARAGAIIADMAPKIRAHLDDDRRGEILREGFRVVLAGPPNVGKSSLLNALARRDAAIVSAEAGTTRDVIEVRLDLEGLLVVVSDTAGIRAPTGPIELEGIKRTLAHAHEADVVVWLSDASSPAPTSLPPELAGRGDAILFCANKTDLATEQAVSALPVGVMRVSAETGAGVDVLASRLAEIARDRIGVSQAPAITRERYRHHLNACLAALEAFRAGSAADIELRAEELRAATHALGRITGRVDVEDVLGEIFARFCIGK